MTLKFFDATGETVTDELVRCDEECTIGGSTYYRGYVNNIINANIKSSASYGVFSAVELGGTDYAILLSGMPTDTATVAVDLAGYVYATTAIDVYLTYLSHGPSCHTDSLVIHAPYLLTEGSAITLCSIAVGKFMKFNSVIVEVEDEPDSSAILTISNGTESQTINITDGTQTFSPMFKVSPEESLIISTTSGHNANEIRLILQDV